VVSGQSGQPDPTHRSPLTTHHSLNPGEEPYRPIRTINFLAEETLPAAGPAAADPQVQISVGGVTIEGQESMFEPQTGLLTITGNPRAYRGEDEIRATRLIINPRTRQFTAEGDVILRQGGQEFRATRATYSFADRTGQAENASSLFGTYYVDAQEIFLRGGPTYEARKARFTTCPPGHRHYEASSRDITIVPGQRLVAKSVGIDFLGRRLVTIPRFTRSLQRQEDGEAVYPSFGFNSRDGFYAEQDWDLSKSAPVWLEANARVNTFREPSGGLLAATPGNRRLVGTVYYRDTAENQRARHLQVSRLPEIGIVWSPTEQPNPGQFLSHQITGVGYPTALDVSTRWRLAGQITGGYFRQHHGEEVLDPDGESKFGGRLSMQVQGVLPVAKLGPLSLNNLRFLARQSIYDTGDHYQVFGTGIGKRFKLGHWRVGVERFDQFTAGSTPFLFDDVELKEEWRPQVEYHTRNFNLSYYARIRGGNGALYDQVFAVSRLFHCIEPRLTYRARRQEIGLDIRIPGLSGFRSRPPGAPRTQSTGEAPAPAAPTAPAMPHAPETPPDKP
jgi:hypothetical protein